MANLTELEQWEAGIYQLETTDVVEGGETGIDNLQPRQLANRTSWLKAQLTALGNLLGLHEAAADPHPQYLTPAEAQVNAMKTAVAGGTADAITAVFAPAIAALTAGMMLCVRAGAANATTTPTFTPAAGVIAAKTIVKGNGVALAAGDIAGAGHWIELQYDLTLDKWILLNPASSVTTSGVQRFTSNGSFTVPAGVTTIYASGCAGGGGGGAGGGGTSGCGSAGAGGGAGQPAIRVPISVTPGQVIPITIGGAGVAGATDGATGGNGGDTLLGAAGALLTLSGGFGGGGGNNVNGTSAGPSGGAGYPKGGAAPDTSNNVSGGTGGVGASGPFGGGGSPGRNGSASGFPGAAAYGYGTGGGGGGSYYIAGAGTFAAGGAGAPGILIIEW